MSQTIFIEFHPHDTAFHVKPQASGRRVSTRGSLHCIHRYGRFDGIATHIQEFQQTHAVLSLRLQDTPADVFLYVPYEALDMTSWEKGVYQWKRWAGKLQMDQARISLTDSTIHPISSCLWRHSFTSSSSSHDVLPPPPATHTRTPLHHTAAGELYRAGWQAHPNQEFIRFLINTDEDFGVQGPQLTD